MVASHDPELLALQEVLVGRYSLEREIGRGGMGVVYLAHEVALDRPVALKLLPPALAVQPTLKERFLREARTAAKLSHPNIVPIHAVDDVDGFVFFAMAYIEGETLGERVRTKGPLPGKEAARILREVAWALAYAHAQGVVHRDIKPDNILLERGSGRALVTDFGIAHVGREPGITGVGDVLGTAEFMSPEQAGGEAVGPGSDIYSLGVVGFFALTAALPFQGKTTAAVLAKHLTQPAPPLTTVAPEAPHRLETVIDRCLRKAPDERFSDGREVADAIGEGVRSAPEMPVPLRLFVNKIRDFAASVPLLAFLWAIVAVVPFVAVLLGEPWQLAELLILPAALILYALVPLAAPWLYARRLQKAGYGVEDARLALKADVERRLEEIRFEFGKGPTRVDRVLKVLTWGGFTLLLTAVLAAVLSLPMGSLGPLGIVGGNVGLISFFAGAFRNKRRKDPVGEGSLAILQSKLGDALFKLGGIGLERASLGGGAHRPTEMAIGMAVDRLFEELPRTLRRELENLPETVQMLEDNARKIRQRVDRLTGVMTEIGPGSDETVAKEQERLKSEVEAKRVEAGNRMTEAVSALEAIRLGLLRLHAGEGSVEGLTASLGAAEDVLAHIERLLEGKYEVERLLAGRNTGDEDHASQAGLPT